MRPHRPSARTFCTIPLSRSCVRTARHVSPELVAATWPHSGGLSLSVCNVVGTNGNLIIPSWGVYDSVVGDGGGMSVTSATDQAVLFYKVTTP